MSADRQRLVSSIRRIAKTDPEIRGLLDAADNKGGKPGAAGVGGGLANEEGDNTANETRICCDGSVGDPNPGVDERNPDSGGQTGGLDSSDPAKLSMGEGTLSGVTDCATGQTICFDGGGFIPPDGWDEPSEPPLLQGYEEGNYFRHFAGGGTYYYGLVSCNAVKQDFPREDNIGIDYYVSGVSDGVTCNYIYDRESKATGEIFPGQSGTDSTSRLSCSSAPNPVCDNSPPTAEAWPSDGCTNLAIKGGKIVGSKYDPDQDGSYNAPRDSIDLCDGNGNQITLRPSGSSSGGYKTIDAINGGDGYLYRNGKQIARISGDEFTDPNV